MIKTTITIDGMMCAMCESHVNDTIRNNFKIKKVASSHAKGTTDIISESALDEAALRETIGKTGYKVLEIKTEPYEKKKFSFPLSFRGSKGSLS
ncbi:MAG: heavy-metal-associated domain-containing protein [Ruminococcus sp.]|nr:heavy-metal-associated domain-containing protein [Ruminococcus sp.]